jgi:hypothetical protein
VPATSFSKEPPALADAGGLANDCTGVLMLSMLPLLAARLCGPSPDIMASRRANYDVN